MEMSVPFTYYQLDKMEQGAAVSAACWLVLFCGGGVLLPQGAALCVYSLSLSMDHVHTDPALSVASTVAASACGWPVA